MKSKTIIFDLDDTLFNEVDYLFSAYRQISKTLSNSINNSILETEIFNLMCAFFDAKKNVFEEILLFFKIEILSKNDLLEIYRNHIPKINLDKQVIGLLDSLKGNQFNLGLITDGRSVQQRNKIKSLNLEKYFERIIISEEFGSEKPSLENFKVFEDLFPNSTYFYIADNPKKDFIGPNKMDWITICLLDNGKNIHKQNFDVSKEYLPRFFVKELKEVSNFIRQQ